MQLFVTQKSTGLCQRLWETADILTWSEGTSHYRNAKIPDYLKLHTTLASLKLVKTGCTYAAGKMIWNLNNFAQAHLKWHHAPLVEKKKSAVLNYLQQNDDKSFPGCLEEKTE